MANKEVVISVVVVLVLLALGVFLTQRTDWFSSSYNSSIMYDENGFPINLPADECSQDSDCIPAGCCHSIGCVPQNMASKCEGILCTQVCSPGTLDCGQGSCGCVNGKCNAVFNKA